jgi:hypothetical protein
MNAGTEMPEEKPADKAPKKGDKKQATPAKEEQKAKAVEPDEVDAEESEDPHPVPRKALIAERKKRQELERRLAQMEGQVSVYQQSTNQAKNAQAPQEPSRPEDQFYRDPVAFVDQRLAQQRLQISEELVRSQHPEDYQAAVDSFTEAVKASPHLLNQFRSHNNPAAFAYETGKAFADMKDVGSLDEYRAKVRAELEAEIEAKLRKEGALTAANNATTSAAGARGSGSTTTAEYSGPTSLRKIFPGTGI